MGGQQSSKKTLKSKTDNNTSSAVSLNDIQSERRMIQNYLVIWIDGNINEKNDDTRRTLAELKNVVNDVNICTKSDECIKFLNGTGDSKAYIISSGSLGQQLVPDIHGMSRVDSIYIFCSNKARHEQWALQWTKIQGVFTSIQPICESLHKVTRLCDNDSVAMNFVPQQTLEHATDSSQQQNLNQLPPIFMYSVLFKDIVMEIDFDDRKSVKDLIEYCRKQGIPEAQLKIFQKKYKKKSPIWLYTCEIFLYGMLNYALRVLDMEGMAKMGFFIKKLHQRLADLYQQQSSKFTKAFLVYRGQGLSPEDFQNLSNSKGGLLSFNNFLSTSRTKEISMRFIQHSLQKNKDFIGVLFLITVDPQKIAATETPFAWVDDESAVARKEHEILFTMHTIFRVIDIKQIDENSHLYEVQLNMTGDNDPQMAVLTQRLKQEFDGRGWRRLGKLMLTLGHFDQAEELYYRLLESSVSDTDKAFINQQLGQVKFYRGEYQASVNFYNTYLKLREDTVAEDNLSVSATYNNIALACNNMGSYSKALEFYNKAHEIKEKALPPNHHDLATSYDNIGQVYNNMGDYSKALEFYNKSHKVKETALPSNHPSLATSYNNIAGVYNSMGNQSEALELYEKSLKIYREALPPIHPDLATSYNNIGLVYNKMGDYLKAREFYERSLEVDKKILPPNHPSLATSYNNIAGVYNSIGNHSKALELYEKSLKVREEALPPNHPDLAQSYNNIGTTYYGKGDYAEALQYLEIALAVFQSSLPSTHPNIESVKRNIEFIRNRI